MDFGVGQVEKLLRHKVTRLGGELFGSEDRPGHALDRGREQHFRAEALQQPATLPAHVFRHRQNQPVPLDGADERQPDAGVARGGLDNRVAGLKRAAAFGVLDHRAGDAILDGAARIDRFELGDDLRGVGRRNPAQTQHRRRANQVEHAFGD